MAPIRSTVQPLRSFRVTIGLLLIALPLTGLSAGEDTRSRQEQPDTLRVAVLTSWPPHFQVDAQGEPRGFAVDVMRAVATRASVAVRFVPFGTFPEATDALRRGDVEVIPDYGITDSRADEFAFTRPFEAFPVVVFARSSDPRHRSLSDLAGARIGTVESNVGVGLAPERIARAVVVVLPSVEEALLRLLAADVDAVVYPEEVFEAVARAAQVDDRIVVVSPALAEVPRGMALRQGNPALAAALDQALDDLVGSPEYGDIYRRWFSAGPSFWTTRHILWLGGGLLVLTLVGMAVWRYRGITRLARQLARTLAERDAAQEASQREEQRFRTVVETINEGIVISNAESRIVFVNPSLCQLVGAEEDDLVGEDLFAYVDASYHERLREGIARRQAGLADAYELGIRRTDGTEVRVLVSVAPLQERGEFRGSVAVLTDITERTRMEEALRGRERRFRAFVENATDLISTLDAEGQMGYQSPPVTRMLGYRPDELEGSSVFEYVHPEDLDSARTAWAQTLERPGQPVHLTAFRFRHEDGSWRVLTATLTNLLQDPAVKAVLSNAQDVTERHSLERQLQQAQRLEAVGRLASGIAHDFNNLLTVIRSQADLMLLDLAEDDALAGEMEVIQSAADRAAQLTSQLLSFSREQVLQPEVVSLCEVVRDTAGLLDRVIGEDVRVVVDVPGNLPAVRVDPGQLEQVVLNLGVNARDAMPSGGILRLSTRKEMLDPQTARSVGELAAGTYTVLEVADTGSGMDEKTLARAFEPFFTTKQRGKGTGLGLAMAYGFVKQSQGSIQVESRPGAGTTFTLWFPSVAEEPAPRSAPARPKASRETETRTLLLVEDDDSVRRAIDRTLSRAGFDVLAVPNAEAARGILDQREDLFLLLTDLVLPGGSGWTLVDHARATRPALPVMVMSGYAEDTPGHTRDLPADIPFLQKPFAMDRLVEAVRQFFVASPTGEQP